MKNLTIFAAAFALGVSVFGQKMTDQQFVDDAAQINMTEAHMGKLAQEKAAGDDVKQYGQKLVSDHTDAYQKLSMMSGLNVPKAIDAQHLKAVTRFEKMSGKQFDQQFKRMMIQDHEKAIKLFQSAENQLTNVDLKKYAGEQLPVLKEHLQRAQDLGTKKTS